MMMKKPFLEWGSRDLITKFFPYKLHRFNTQRGKSIKLKANSTEAKIMVKR
jgi:hypothetical protein